VNQEILELDQKSLRNFAWVFAAVMASVFGLILPWLLNRNWPWEPWVIAIVFFAWGLVAPKTLRPFYRLWMRFGFMMNAVVTRIVLGVVFYAAIFPYGIVYRLRGKDLMRHKWEPQLSSYRVKSRKANNRHMERPF
jgi:predicted membrane metal-binding protein